MTEAFWDAGEGIRLRYQVDRADSPRASVVLVQGRAEFIEKYSEVISELTQRHCDVWSFDLRGQGLSSRLLPHRQRGHVDDFVDYESDLRRFIDDVVGPGDRASGRRLLFGHSLGAHIALSALVHGGLAVDRALFTSPLVDFPDSVRRRVFMLGARLLDRTPLRDRYGVLGDWSLLPFDGNVLSTDPVRYAVKGDWISRDPRLAQGGPTLHWLVACRRSIARLRASDPSSVQLPICCVLAGADQLVDNRATATLIARFPRAELHPIAGSAHEVLFERDPFRERFWEIFDGFMGRED